MSDQNIKAIMELRKRDAEAAKSEDFETLRSIMSDDAVMLPPGGKRLEGKSAIDEAFGSSIQKGNKMILFRSLKRK